MDPYTLAQAEEEIAQLRGQVDMMAEYISTQQIASVAGMPLSQSDTTQYTVTQTAITPLTNAWSIPASDANVGTMYRLKSSGMGTQGSTASQLNFLLSLNGASTHALGLAASLIPASQAFVWSIELVIAITAAGATGTFNDDIAIIVSGNLASQSPTAGSARSNTAFAINTTISNTFGLGFYWSSSTGAPTISSYWSSCERLGIQ